MPPDILAALREALAGRFEVHEEIGRGGMATVFRATDRRDGRIVAMKVLDPRLQEVIGGDRFHREIAILSRLQHPAILPLLDSGTEAGFLFYVMPFVAGESLRQRLKREPQLPVREAVSIARTVLAALHYAHKQNVLHRDIKPENVLLEHGRPLVADFGIARAIIRSGGDSISSTGLAIGTPAYMSPEQGVGESRLDGRSDVYATGCLLFEMLAGTPPFTGPTVQAIQARHLHEPPPPVRVVRPTVPVALQTSIEKALAKVPSDRYRSAAEFSRALEAALRSQPVPARTARARRRTVLVAAGAVTVLAALTLILWRPTTPLDVGLYLVFPCRHRGSTVHEPVSADNCTRLIWESLSRWRDLRLVDEAVVEDRLRRGHQSPPTLSSAMEMARGLRAGLLVWGELALSGDSVRVRASLFRVGRKVQDPVQRAEVALPAGVPEGGPGVRLLVERFGELASGLLLPRSEGRAEPATLKSTPYYRAFRATLSGDSALLRWNLDLARERYREAFTIDPEYAAPRLRFAQASLWADAPVSEWSPAAEAALIDTAQLGPLEQVEAEALVALGRGDFPRACERYQSILRQDSLRFAGWFGLGECLTRDSIVIRDPTSPSGWRFRGSYAAGISAYRNALTSVPLAHVAYGGATLDRLSERLLAQSNRMRLGVRLGSPPRRFAAYPSFEADSLAFVPYPFEEVTAGTRTPATWRRALEANRRTLLAITSEWLTRYPGSRAAMRAHALALELAGILGPSAPSALALVRELRRLDDHNRLDVGLAAWETRLRLKARLFTASRVLADSALAELPRTGDEGMSQAALAAMIGRIHLAADLMARFTDWPFATPEGEFVRAPAAVTADAYRLLAYAAFGAPADSIRTIAARLRSEVDRRVEPGRRTTVLEAALFQPSLLAFPLLPPPIGQGQATARIEQALERGDLVAARKGFAELAAIRRVQLPGDVAPDHTVLEARLLLLLGDTIQARNRLELFLDDLDTLDDNVTDLVTQAAAIGRAIVLYREAGGNLKSRGLDSALAALWKHADAPLAVQVGR